MTKIRKYMKIVSKNSKELKMKRSFRSGFKPELVGNNKHVLVKSDGMLFNYKELRFIQELFDREKTVIELFPDPLDFIEFYNRTKEENNLIDRSNQPRISLKSYMGEKEALEKVKRQAKYVAFVSKQITDLEVMYDTWLVKGDKFVINNDGEYIQNGVALFNAMETYPNPADFVEFFYEEGRL